ncbi:MAG: hypothetical protein PHW09_13215, partial [Desulfovibrio desulfuricans]|nr:hypothetical protein [Desulfovibrio desulfuricans]
ASLGLPQDPNNLFFGESATFHSCAPMSGTLTFQWHTFRGEGHHNPLLITSCKRQEGRRHHNHFTSFPLKGRAPLRHVLCNFITTLRIQKVMQRDPATFLLLPAKDT